MTSSELRAWRENHMLSLQALADLLGVDKGTLWRWETGKMTIGNPRMLALALERLDEEKARTPAG